MRTFNPASEASAKACCHEQNNDETNRQRHEGQLESNPRFHQSHVSL